MTSILFLALVLLPFVAAALATWALLRWIANDGGPHAPRKVLRKDDWGTDPSSIPFALRH
jgi:hypothetical protein